MITVSVPGKIHLMGEHAVVYGAPALIAAIDKRLWVRVEKASEMSIETQESPEYVLYALEKVREYVGFKTLPPVRVIVTSDIPAGFHLGSSAAIAVGVVAATLYFFKKIWNVDVINELAYEIEKKQHANPSGGDNTTVTNGGFVWFRKELEFLKIMQPLAITIPTEMNHFYLANTGKPQETTGEMVVRVRKRFEVKQTYMEKQCTKNEQQVKKITLALKEKNEKVLVDAIRDGEKTLEAMGVVSTFVRPFIRSVERVGGAAKILGGGGITKGTGFLLCYHSNRMQLEECGKRFGFPIQNVKLGEQGVRLESEK